MSDSAPVPTPDTACPDCGHSWRAHQGRHRESVRCAYSAFGSQCSCQNMDPEVEAEGRRAAAAWNAYLGRKP